MYQSHKLYRPPTCRINYTVTHLLFHFLGQSPVRLFELVGHLHTQRLPELPLPHRSPRPGENELQAPPVGCKQVRLNIMHVIKIKYIHITCIGSSMIENIKLLLCGDKQACSFHMHVHLPVIQKIYNHILYTALYSPHGFGFFLPFYTKFCKFAPSCVHTKTVSSC